MLQESALGPCPWGRGKTVLVAKELSVAEKVWLGRAVAQKKFSAPELARRFSLSENTIATYARKIKSGLTFMDGGGRPPAIFPEAKNAVIAAVAKGSYATETTVFRELIQDCVNEDLRRRGIDPTCMPNVSYSSVLRFEQQIEVQTGQAELTTAARAEATDSVRNLISHAVQTHFQTVTRNVPRGKILNADGTTFTVGYNQDKVEVKILRKNRDAKHKVMQVIAKRGDADVAMFTIKYYALIGAYGNIFDPIFILQDESMNAEAMDLYEVPGLVLHAGLSGKGYLIFMKSRIGNNAFFAWFFETVLCNAVDEVNRFYGYDADSPTYLQIDGEPIQLKCLENLELLNKLRVKNIDVGKSFFSGTSIVQPADVGNLFRSSKTAIKSLKEAHIINVELRDSIKAVFLKHNEKQKLVGAAGLSSAHTTMGIKGIMRVQLSLQIGVTKNTILKSFAKAVVYPTSLEKSLCLRRGVPITIPQMAAMKAAFPTWVQRFSVQGELLESDFDEFNIAPDAKKVTVPRDQRVVYQRRSVLLTHPEVRNRDLARQERKVEAKETAEAKRKARAERREVVNKRKAARLR
jgi:hypothetical protein